MLISLFSFDAADPSFNLVKSGNYEVQNKAGLFGAYASGFLNDIFGIGALLWPAIFAALSAAYLSQSYTMHWWRWLGFFLLTICLLVGASSLDITLGDLSGGGMVGNSLYYNGKRYLSPIGSFLVWFFIFVCGMQLAFNFSWTNLFSRIYAYLGKKIPQRKPSDGKKENTKVQTTGKQNTIPVLRFTKFFWGLKNGLGHLKKIPELALKIKNVLPSRPRRSPLTVPQLPLDNEPGEMAAPPKTSGARITEEISANSDDPFALSEVIEEPVQPQVAEDPETAPEARVESPHIVEYKVISQPEPDTSRLVVNATKADPGLVAAHADAGAKKRKSELPPLDLLKQPIPSPGETDADREAKGRALMACFRDFDIQAELVGITPGPVVTMYEVRPARGVRVNRIANMTDDLSLALKAIAVRIQAPIPGTNTVGIEIPNSIRDTVNFRELAESPVFKSNSGQLPVIMGKDIAGRPYMADLTKMPHLLVAGATGAGKSVCLNAFLVSLLYRLQPSEMRLLLIDPKRVEMAVYSDLPHLIHPVVTEMSDAKNALEWAVHEMEQRFLTIGRLGVRNVTAYNQKLATFKHGLPADLADLKPLPYLLIVIDELADLMMTAAREVQTSIMRLSQLARAASIHMILATQRPSVDIVTGLIKAQFPARISFQVSSKHDSRTILDQGGAEHLLGRGDMLFKPNGGSLQRLHGPFLSDEEVQLVVNHWKAQEKPEYEIDFSKWTTSTGNADNSNNDAVGDALYQDARAFVLGQKRPSISLLQRHLKIGFNRAARLMDQFRNEGIIGAQEAGKTN